MKTVAIPFSTWIRSATAVLLAGAIVVLSINGCGSRPPGEGTGQGTSIPEKPNIILIVSDALRADVLGCYDGAALTPNIDRLAAEGVLFEQAHSASPWTLPSAVSMFTGNCASGYKYDPAKIDPSSAGNVKGKKIVHYHVPDSDPLVSEALGTMGYDLKMSLENALPPAANNMRGFERLAYDEALEARREEISRITGIPRRGGRALCSFIDYLLTVPEARPFFGVMWIIDPHANYSPVEEYRQRIDFDTTRLPHKPRHYWNLDSKQIFKAAKVFRKNEIEYLKALYQAEVESVDSRVGSIIKAVKHAGLEDRTIVIFTSDHGEAFGEHKFFTHGHTYYEEMVRVPLIISGPGLPRGRRVSNPVSHLDLMPTLLDLVPCLKDRGRTGPGSASRPSDSVSAGSDASETDTVGGPSSRFQGVSFADMLYGVAGESAGAGTAPGDTPFADAKQDDAQPQPHAVYFTDAHGVFYREGLQLGRFKLIVNGRGRKALYDLAEDPEERLNIAQSTAHRERAIRMFNKLLQMRIRNRARAKDTFEAIALRDLSAEEQETLKQMKALGYVQ